MSILEEDFEQIEKYAENNNIKFSNYGKNVINNNKNEFEIDGFIFFYPVNDGCPTIPFKFYKDGKLLLTNENNFSEILNLDEILIRMTRLISYALDQDIVINPYYFMLELGEDFENSGNAQLIMTERAYVNKSLNNENFEEAKKYYINHFLDHFIGWNFGVSINRNEELKKELEALNNKVIDMGMREYAGPGLEVIGFDSEANNGIQHYYLPIEKNAVMQKLPQQMINNKK